MLFGGDSCIEHEPGSGQVSFKQHKQDFRVVKDSNKSSAQCTSIFIEPVSWMLPLLDGIIEGKVCIVRPFIYSLYFIFTIYGQVYNISNPQPAPSWLNSSVNIW